MPFTVAASCSIARHRLRDRDDDIRIAAAASLLPIFEVVVTHLEADLRTLLSVIWDCLSDLSDDLSSSAAGVMDLLGAWQRPGPSCQR